MASQHTNSPARRARPILAVLLALCLPATQVVAFKPTAEFGHVGIVRDAVTPITRTGSDGATLRFSERAIEEIRDATAGVDEIFSSRGELTVPNAHCDDELLPACSQRIRTIKEAIVANLSSGSPDGSAARAQVGRALHTLQDFYSHSNWVNAPGPGNAGANTVLGRGVLGALPAASTTCVDDFFDRTLTGAGLTSLTTGYFGSAEPPPGKCAHGVLAGAGIHKDAPGRPFHAQARAAAVAGTADLINQILDAPGVAGNDEAIRAFMDIRGTLGFVVDDTGSMGPDIAGVRAAVQQIVNRVAGTEDAPDNYVLVRFGDPDVGAPFKTSNPAALLSAVNALFPSGGGDCPELSQAGLLSAISASSSGAKLYLFTDASAKDSALAGNVAAAANAKKISINYVVTGSCSPIDPAYIRVAQETGGQLLFIARSEVGQIFHLIEPSLSGDLRPLLTLNDRFAGTANSYSVPVDGTVRRVMFSLSADSLSSLTLRRPDGDVVLPGDPGVVYTPLSTARIYTVEAPDPGAWTITASGTGALSLSVFGNSPIDFSDAAFVELRGREEHEGLFPLDGQPVVGETGLLRARLHGPVAEVAFERVALDGTLIGSLALQAGAHDDAALDEFTGALQIDDQPFRIHATGTTAQGDVFRRAFAPVFRGQTVKVVALDQARILVPGTAATMRFEVSNLGAAGSFRITASDEARWVGSVAPGLLSLGAGETGEVTVSLAVPSSPDRDVDVLSLFARSTSNPDLGNSALVGLQVGNPDSDDDGLADDVDACPQSDLAASLVIDGCDTRVDNLLQADGCTLGDRIGLIALAVRNHGEFVSEVTRFTQQLVADGSIRPNQRGAIHACAARASIP